MRSNTLTALMMLKSEEDAFGLKIFSATKARDREVLGETVTDWICKHPELEMLDKIVTQSSDDQFHCLCITLFYRAR